MLDHLRPIHSKGSGDFFLLNGFSSHVELSKIHRSIFLPTAINADAIEAGYDQGVLTLHMPKTEEARPKKIVVKIPAMIEGEMKDK
jgi:HSP20 family molecular chaperone IbpA